MSGASIGTLMPLLARWFVKRRTLVLGLVASGSSIGGAVLIIFSGYLRGVVRLAGVLDHTGGHRYHSGRAVGVHIPAQQPGCRWACFPMGIPSQPPVDRHLLRLRRRGLFEVEQWYQSLRSPPIWNLSAAYTVCGITVGLISVHFVPYADGQLGVDPTLAATIFGVLTGLNAIGAIGGGWLADRFGRKNVLGNGLFRPMSRLSWC